MGSLSGAPSFASIVFSPVFPLSGIHVAPVHDNAASPKRFSKGSRSVEMMIFRMVSTTCFVTAILMLLVQMHAQITQPRQDSARGVINRFCELDANGKQLNPEGQKQITGLLVNEKQVGESAITIVKDYSVRDLSIQKDTAEFAVDYGVLARVDSSLRFARLQAPYTNRPLLMSERFSLIFSDTHFELESDGRWQEIKGVPEWRIKT